MSVKAKSLKEAGNDAFRQARYNDAVLLYSEACQLDPSEYTYPLNRCMTYLKLGKLREAERDATKSLQLLPAGNTKALFRRGLARKGLGKMDLARQDLIAALKEEPSNADIKAELDSLPQSSREPSDNIQRETNHTTSTPSKPTSLAADKQASERQHALKAAIEPERNGKASGSLLSEVSSRRLKESPTQKQARMPALENPQHATSPETISREPSSSQTTLASTGKDFKSLRAARNQRLASFPQPVKDATQASIGTGFQGPQALASQDSVPKATLETTIAPKSMYDFETRWINEKAIDARAAMIVALVTHCASLPDFFGSSLTPELLDDMLSCLDIACREYPEVRDKSIAFLHDLPRCARFDFVSMLCANSALVKNIVATDPRSTRIMSAWGVS